MTFVDTHVSFMKYLPDLRGSEVYCPGKILIHRLL